GCGPSPSTSRSRSWSTPCGHSRWARVRTRCLPTPPATTSCCRSCGRPASWRCSRSWPSPASGRASRPRIVHPPPERRLVCHTLWLPLSPNRCSSTVGERGASREPARRYGLRPMVALLYAPDSRGNRLERYWVGMRPDRSEYYVHLHCADEIASQVRNVLRPLEVADCLRGQDVLEWTHRLSFSGPYTTLHRDLLELLTTVLTLPPVLELNLVLALDFHKVPPDLAAGRTD